MKKRKSRAKNTIHTPLQFLKLQQKLVVSAKNNSSRELKRRYIIGDLLQEETHNRALKEKLLPLAEDTFNSLDSFFDVKKQLSIPNVKFYVNYDCEEISSESCSVKSSKHSSNSKSNPVLQHYETPNFNVTYDIRRFNDLSLQLLNKSSNYLNMVDTKKFINKEMNNGRQDNDNLTSPNSPHAESKSDGDLSNTSSEELEEIPEVSPEEEQQPDLSTRFDFSHTYPTSTNELFNSTVTDSEVMREMTEASQRCATIEKEIEQLRNELKELQQKEDLNDNDKKILDLKRDSLMEKMEELDVMTSKIQETLGLVDLSSDAFAKVFETFIQSQSSEVKNMRQIDEEEKAKKMVSEWQTWEDQVPEDNRFDLPQQEYPEDRLPRIIVCGYTEDKFPKIVVADSERRPKAKEIQCLESITGKLAEALDTQAKLAKENAQLEGGKYKLAEALIEKDDAVDILQKKVCGLQAEMQMIIKENSELSRQLTELKQRLTSQFADSPRSFHHSPPSISRHNISRSHRCQYCMQDHRSNTVCVNPLCNKQRDHNPSRLGGGGSQENIVGNLISVTDQNTSISSQDRNNIQMSQPTEFLSGRIACPAEIENKITNYETTTKHLEQQLGNVESDVRNMKMILANVQREQQQLDQQKKLLACTGPCAPCPCTPSTTSQGSPRAVQIFRASTPIVQESQEPIKQFQAAPGSVPSCTGDFINVSMGGSNCPLQQLRDLREQYIRLQEDYKNKLTEVSCLRTDAEKMKNDTREAKDAKEKAENRLIDLEERLKIYESDRNRYTGSKEHLVEREQTLIVAKQRYREAQDELEELRSLLQYQANQLQDYRNKYLQAQEQVEEQRRQIELMEMDNARMNDNVTLEIGRVKNQFQEKLSELAPLPDILKQTQIKLQESQQMRLIAEKNCEELRRELLNCKDRIGAMTSQSEILKTENAALKGSDLDNLEDKNRDLRNENERLKNSLARCDDRENEYKKHLEDKKHEIAQLSSMLEQMREDSARQVARTKERCDTIRRQMQGQISEMEKQLVHCRATAKAAQKDRDEIRQKMQGQINHLSEAFDHAQTRIKNLQGHIDYLKPLNSNVYSVGGSEEDYRPLMTTETNQNTYDPCDCNY